MPRAYNIKRNLLNKVVTGTPKFSSKTLYICFSLLQEMPCSCLHCHCYCCCFCCSVTQSYPILCDPRNCNTTGLPVSHHLPEFAQVHVHCIGDAIQPSHPLSPLSFCLHQGLIQRVTCSHQMTKILELQH